MNIYTVENGLSLLGLMIAGWAGLLIVMLLMAYLTITEGSDLSGDRPVEPMTYSAMIATASSTDDALKICRFLATREDAENEFTRKFVARANLYVTALTLAAFVTGIACIFLYRVLLTQRTEAG